MHARTGRVLAALVAAATLGVGLRWGTFAAGGADSYAYVSQAFLWTRGTLIETHPFADLAPTFGEWTFAPLGYRPGPTPGTLVPIYPPGLPLAMTAAAVVAGPWAVYLVVPMLGALAVVLTYRLGVYLDGVSSGLASACLLATSPIFLYQLVQPLSDVPVTAWWLLSMLLALSGGRRAALTAGLAASAAILTRPNLVLLALVPGALAWSRTPDPRTAARVCRVLWFLVGACPGPLGVAGLHAWLYGSPLRSGYGTLDELYALAHIAPNVARYTGWLVDTHTIFPLLAFAAPWFATSGEARGHVAAAAANARRVIGLLLAGVLLVVASYLPYALFDDWWYLRFLLPAWPSLILLATIVTRRALERAARWMTGSSGRPALGVLLFVVGTAALASWYVRVAAARHVFDLQRLERRYPETGHAVRTRIPEPAVLLAAQQSGSLRFYAGRATVRWDLLAPDALEALVTTLTERGFRPYLVVEAPEERVFRERFAATSPLGRLDWPPLLDVRSAVAVRVYDPRDRARYVAGERVDTELVWPAARRPKRRPAGVR
jgi:hypothetical protein